jgi:putative transposase
MEAMVTKVLEGGRVCSKALMIAIEMHQEGHQEVLTCDIWDGEIHLDWKSCLEGLSVRGIFQVDLVVSDAHQGLVRALQQVFLGAS